MREIRADVMVELVHRILDHAPDDTHFDELWAHNTPLAFQPKPT